MRGYRAIQASGPAEHGAAEDVGEVAEEDGIGGHARPPLYFGSGSRLTGSRGRAGKKENGA